MNTIIQCTILKIILITNILKYFTLVGDHPYLRQTLTKTNINNAED